MRIFAKKALRFEHPSNEGPSITVRPLSFADVPDWVAHTRLFEWAQSDGDITVTATKSEEVQAENDATDDELASLHARAKELGLKGYANMKRDTLEAKIAEAEAASKNGDE